MKRVKELGGLVLQRIRELQVQGQGTVAIFKSLKACSMDLSL